MIQDVPGQTLNSPDNRKFSEKLVLPTAVAIRSNSIAQFQNLPK